MIKGVNGRALPAMSKMDDTVNAVEKGQDSPLGTVLTLSYCFSNRTPDCVRGSRTARYAGGVKA